MKLGSRIRKILLAVLTVFIAIQFIRPARNQSSEVMQTDILNIYDIPANVYALFKNACYDCHSNNTVYPWYFNVQPMAWMVAKDIKDGKEKMNFSDFGSLSHRKQLSRLRSIENQIRDGAMPLPSYKLTHKSARLNEEDKKLLFDWIDKTIQQQAQ